MDKAGGDELKSLALELKAACDKNGQEINSIKSAKIIHKLGLAHLKHRQDQISLIKSVGLLNSAIARKPNNADEIQRDLSSLCQLILRKANAQNQSVNLIEHAKFVKSQIESMRDKARKALSKIKNITKFGKLGVSKTSFQHKLKIKSVKLLQIRITAHYKKIMQLLCQFCEDVMGPPPCKFAVVGMGSLARKEITPFSDFEHIILLEIHKNYQINLNYFRWFSVIFHTIILNLQETIIPSLNVKYLNDKMCELNDWFFDTHTSGVSFDGMMPHACKFPLGRTEPTKEKPWTTELIKPVDQMLEYLSSEESLKNGYHLSDILTETCFVYGYQSLHDDFKKGIDFYKESRSSEELLDDLKQQVKEDLDKFATRIRLTHLKPTGKLNVKQMFYRTSTLFVAMLGKMCRITASSCFAILDQLAERKLISENARFKLSLGVAIACEVRLGIYMQENSQRDYIQPRKDAETIFDNVLKVIDMDSIISYFQITYCLQREVIKLLKISGTHLYSNFSLINITICYALRLDNLMLVLLKEFTENNDSSISKADTDFSSQIASHEAVLGDILFRYFDEGIYQLEKEINSANFPDKEQKSQTKAIAIFENFLAAFENLLAKNSLGEALEFLTRVEEILLHSSLSEQERREFDEETDLDVDVWTVVVQMIIAYCLLHLQKIQDAEGYVILFLNNADELNNNPTVISVGYFLAGDICFKIKRYEKSLNCLQTSLGIALSNTSDTDEIDHKIYLLSGIGFCLLKLRQFEESWIFINAAIQMIKENEIPKTEYDFFEVFRTSFGLVTTHHSAGKCLMNLHHYEEAFSYLNQALTLATEGGLVAEDNQELPAILEKEGFVGKTLTGIKNLAGVLFDIGVWYAKQNSFSKASIYLKRSLNIYEKFPSSMRDAESIAATRFELLTCSMEAYQRDRLEKRIKVLSKSEVKVTSVVILNPLNGTIIDKALLYFKIGKMYFKLQRYATSLFFLQISLGIALSNEFVDDEQYDMMVLYSCMGTCLLYLDRFQESLYYLDFAVRIIEEYDIVQDDENLKAPINRERTYQNLGKCLMNMQRFEEAVTNFGKALDIVNVKFVSVDIANKLQNHAEKSDSICEQAKFLASIFYDCGMCYMKQNRLKEAITQFQQAFDIQNNAREVYKIAAIRIKVLTCYMEVFQRKRIENYLKDLQRFKETNYSVIAVSSVINADVCVCDTFYFKVGHLYLKMQKYEKSLSYLQTFLGLALSDTFEDYDAYFIMITYSGIGTCLLMLKQYQESLVYLNHAVQMIEKYGIEKDDNYFKLILNRSTTYQNLGKCLIKLQRAEEALPHLQKALAITKQYSLIEDKADVFAIESSLNERINKFQAGIFYDFGKCYSVQNRFKDAIDYFQKVFIIYKSFSEIENTAATRVELLTCYMAIYQRERITNLLKHLQVSGKITTPIVVLSYGVDVAIDFSLQFTFGNLYFKSHQYKKSLTCLQTFVGIALSEGLEDYDKYYLMIAYSGIGTCLVRLHRHEEAHDYLKLAVQMIEMYKIDEDDDYYGLALNRATTYHNLGKCSILLQQFRKGILYLLRALEIITECSLNEKIDNVPAQLAEKYVSNKRKAKILANILYDIGSWYMQHNYFRRSINFLNSSLYIYKKHSEVEAIAATHCKILTCYMEMYQRKRIEDNLKNRTTHTHVNICMARVGLVVDDVVAKAALHFKLGCVHFKKNCFEKSLFSFRLQLGIALSNEFVDDEQYDIMVLYSCMGTCLLYLDRFQESLYYLDFAVRIIEEYDIVQDDENLKAPINRERTYQNLGKCLMNLQRFEEAFSNFGKALDIVNVKFVAKEMADKLQNHAEKSDLIRKQAKFLASIFYDCGMCYMKQNRLKEAITQFQQAFDIQNNACEVYKIATIRIKLLTCYMEVFQRKRIENYLKDLHRRNKMYCSVATRCSDISFVVADATHSLHLKAGNLYFKKQQFAKSLSCLQIFLALSVSENLEKCGEYYAMITYSGIGTCLLKLKEYQESLIYLNLAVQMMKSYGIEADDKHSNMEFNCATTYLNLGKCLMELQKFEESFSHFQNVLKLTIVGENLGKFSCNVGERTFELLDLKQREQLADTYRAIGLWYMKQNIFTKAINNLQTSFDIYKDCSNAQGIASTRAELLTSIMQTYIRERIKHDTANSKDVLIIPLAPIVDKDIEKASLHFKIGNVCFKKQLYEKSLLHFQISIGIALSKDFVDYEQYDMMVLYCSLGSCLLALKEYEESLYYLEFAVTIIEAYEIVKDEDHLKTFINRATAFQNFGKCLIEMHQFEKAMSHLRKAFEIITENYLQKNYDELLTLTEISALSDKKLKKISSIYSDFVSCYMIQNQFEKAIPYIQACFHVYYKLSEMEQASYMRYKLLICYMEIYQRKRVEITLKNLPKNKHAVVCTNKKAYVM